MLNSCLYNIQCLDVLYNKVDTSVMLIHQLYVLIDCQCARVSIVTLTLSRYILESSLLDYMFVGRHESLMAAACLLLAMYMNKEGVWVCL